MKLARLLVVAAALLAAPAPRAAPRTETAVLAGGCFWGMEAVFEHVKGVTDVVSGYAGGSARDANYDAVSSEAHRPCRGGADHLRPGADQLRASCSRSISRSPTTRPR